MRYEVNAVMAVYRLRSPRVGRMRNDCHVILAGLTWADPPLLAMRPSVVRCPVLGAELLPRRVRRNQPSAIQSDARVSLSKLAGLPPRRKIDVTSKSPVGDISVVTLTH